MRIQPKRRRLTAARPNPTIPTHLQDKAYNISTSCSVPSLPTQSSNHPASNPPLAVSIDSKLKGTRPADQPVPEIISQVHSLMHTLEFTKRRGYPAIITTGSPFNPRLLSKTRVYKLTHKSPVSPHLKTLSASSSPSCFRLVYASCLRAPSATQGIKVASSADHAGLKTIVNYSKPTL